MITADNMKNRQENRATTEQELLVKYKVCCYNLTLREEQLNCSLNPEQPSLYEDCIIVL